MTKTRTKANEAMTAPPPEKSAAALVEIGERGIMLRSLEDLLRFARMAVSGGAAPKSMSEGQAAVAIQAGLERGLGPLGGLTQCVVINGVLSWRGQGAFALIQNSGLCRPGTLKFWTEGKGEERKGVAAAHRVGYGDPSRKEFTVKDAKQARLWGKAGPWTEYPDRMLAWRALGLLARDVFPDVLGGFPIAEEAFDYEGTQRARRAPEGAKPEPKPPPSTPDPLLDVMEGKAAEVVDGEVVSEEPEQPKDETTQEEPQGQEESQKSQDDDDRGLSCKHGKSFEEPCDLCIVEDDEKAKTPRNARMYPDE